MRWLARWLVLVAVVAVALAAVSLASLIGYARVESGRQVTLPAPTGPYRVGRTLFDWVDRSRTDPYAPNKGTPRELAVLVWYPATPAPGAVATSYLPPGWERALGTDTINDLAHTAPSLIHPRAVEDAPVTGSGLPVLVLSPGLGLQASDYTALAEQLASQGYLVAGVNPTYSTDVVLSGGRVVRSIDRARDNAVYDTLVQVWADDLRFVASQVQALGGQFQGRLGTARVGFLGHSAGGAAATLACRHDEHCAGAADIDGDLAGDVIQTGLGRPFLFLGDRNALAKEPYLKGMLRGVAQNVPPGQSRVLTVVGAGHEDFTDRSLYFNIFSARLGFVGSIDGTRALRLTSAYVRAFFDECLRGQAYRDPSYPEVRTEAV